MSLLRNEFGMGQSESIIEFEKRVEVVNNNGSAMTK